MDITVSELKLMHLNTALWLKAPNGQPSLLNEQQWLQVRTSQFKQWFGDWENDPANSSQVLDCNGEPLIVYHGTPPNHYEFSEFSVNDEGIFFAEHEYVAKRYSSNYRGDEFGSVKAVFLNLRKAKFIKSVGYKYDGFLGADASLKKRAEKFKKAYPELRNTPYRYKELIREQFQKQKYDGMILEDHSWNDRIDYCKQFVVFQADQIKSATGNLGSFSRNNDIYL